MGGDIRETIVAGGGVPEVVAASSSRLQVRSEERFGERAFDGVEEGVLRSRRDSVDGAERKTQKTIV